MTHEPVAWMSPDESSLSFYKLREDWVPLYTMQSNAVLAEREACAQIAFNAKTYIEAAAAIRARNKT